MQPSEYEIQREVEALRDLRRRSTAGGPGSLILDPDLPSASSQTSPTTTYWPTADDSSSSSSHEEGSDNGATGGDDPFHLFWVPARLHPEIAPAEFRQFLKEHARTPSDESGALGRSLSSGSIGLGRKKSMLSRQYKPSPNDGIEEEKEETVLPVRRNRTSIYASVPQLTINDLQKLEQLAEEASKSDDPSKLRSVLRRSLSLNVAPSVIDQMDDMPDLGDDADSPIVIPRPNQALRRSARTKIRKPGQTGEGAHRFTATRSRRKSISRANTMQDPRSSSEMSVSDHGHAESSRLSQTEDVSEGPFSQRPESYSEEALIYDAYATEDTDESETPIRTASPEQSVESSTSPPSTTSHAEPEPTTTSIAPEPVLYHPQPQRAVAPDVPEPPAASTSPSPQPQPQPSPVLTPASTPSSRPSLQESATYLPAPSSLSEQRREKDKKGGLFKWGSSDKSSKKAHKDKDTREREKEKETGFFGSLFGARKKQEEATPPLGVGQSGRETAAALLGASKSSKNYVPPASPQLAGMYARYPIHVERAIYRLSHIKLANPRRPLYEQVLISNLMFWYLGVINKTQATNTAQANGNVQVAAQGQSTPNATPDKEQLEREQREKEERERMEKERLERDQEQKEKQRRGSLSKPSSVGSSTPGGRRAEVPVRGPQYEMQHRAMEQEYGYSASSNSTGVPPGRTPTVPTSASNGYQNPPATRSSSAPPAPYTVPVAQPQPQAPNGGLYSMGNVSMQPQQYAPMVVGSQLPPGAMPPIAVEQTWLVQSGSTPLANSRGQSSPSPPHSRSTSPPSSSSAASPQPRRTRSPPPNRYTPAQEKQPYSGGRLPSRSLSATAAPPVQTMHHVNGKLKKGTSAHAVVQNHRRSEDEDMPLAMWQQQQRRK